MGAAEQWQDDHEARCEERMSEVRSRLTGLEQTVSGIATNQALIMQGMGVREATKSDGSTVVKTKLIKWDWKLALQAAGAFSGLTLLYQFIVAAAVPALIAAHHWLLSPH